VRLVIVGLTPIAALFIDRNDDVAVGLARLQIEMRIGGLR
jgi:hypothetical protein